MMTQKGNPYTSTCSASALSRVRFLSWILSRLNSLCTSPAKQYYTKNNDQPSTYHGNLAVPKATSYHRNTEWSTYLNVQYFIGSKTDVLNVTIIRYVSHKCRLSSNIKQTTRESVYLVRPGHFQSRDKDGSRTVRSVIAKNPMLHADYMALSSIEPDLL